jgi:CRP-like cAMP-binding protein
MLPEELVNVSPFQGLRAEQVNRLAPLMRPAQFTAGETIFTEGQAANEFHVLQSGEVVIRFYPYDGGQLDLATLRPGDVFGWSAALGRACYTSSAICLSDVLALSLHRDDLRQVRRADPDMGVWLFEHLARVVASRFESLRAQIIALWRAQMEVERQADFTTSEVLETSEV